MARNDESVNLLISALVDGLENVASLTGELKTLEKASQDQLNDNTKDLKEGAGETTGVMESLRANIGKVVAAGAALGGIAATLRSVSSEAADYETRFAKLEGVVRATGKAAGFSADEIRSLSQELALATLGSVEEFENAAAALLTFKSITGDAFGQALELSKDLAEVMGGDAKSSAVQLGKALEDPKKGLTSLSRAGVTFTEEQKAVIESLVETGEQGKAQALILEQVANQVGGVARNMAGGMEGALDTLSQRFEELKVATGDAINPALESLTNNLAEALNAMASNIDEIIAGAKIVGAVAIVAFATKMAGAISTANVRLVTMSATLKAMPGQINAAANSMGRLQKSVALVGSAFVGWEIGTRLKDEFVGVEKAGIALAAGLTKLAERAKFALTVLATPHAIGPIDNISSAYDRLGDKLDEIDDHYFELFQSAGKATEEQVKLADQTEKTAEQLEQTAEEIVKALKKSVDAANKETARLQSNLEGLEDEVEKAVLKTEQAWAALNNSSIDTQEKALDHLIATTEAETKARQAAATAAIALNNQIAASQEKIAKLAALTTDEQAEAAKTAREELAKLGVDAGKVFDNISNAAQSSITSLEDVVKHIKTIGGTSEEQAAAFNTAFKKALENVSTAEEFAAIEKKVRDLFSADKIDKSALDAALAEIQIKAEDISEIPLEKPAKELTKELTNAEKAAAALKKKLAEQAEEQEKLQKHLSDRGNIFTKMINGLSANVLALGQKAAEAFRHLQFGDAETLSGLDLYNQKLATAEQRVNELSTALAHAGGSTLRNYFTELALNAARVEENFWRQKLALDSLISSVEGGQFNLRQLEGAAGRAAYQFNLLDDSDLSQLTSAIDAARNKLEALNASAEDTLINLRERLADLRGDTAEAEQIRQAQEIKALEAQLEAAEASGAKEAVKKYQDSLTALRKIHALENAQMKEQEKERAAQAEAEKKRLETQEKERIQREREAATTTNKQDSQPGGAGRGFDTIIQLQLDGKKVNVGTDNPADLLNVLEQAGLRSA